MNKQKLASSIVLLFSLFLMVSCTNEPVDPALTAQLAAANAANGGGSGGGTTAGGGTSSGDYFPAALNNQWVFTQNGVAQAPMKMISIDNINGFTYYTFSPTSGSGATSSATATQRLRKSSGDYFFKTDDSNISSGGISGVQTGFELLILKDYLPVGGTWTGSYNQTTTYNNPAYPVISSTTNYTGTILEVGSSVVVGSTTYSNVIKMSLHESVSMMGITSEVDTDYWFAKNVGIVKSITYATGSTTTPQYTSLLTSYTLN